MKEFFFLNRGLYGYSTVFRVWNLCCRYKFILFQAMCVTSKTLNKQLITIHYKLRYTISTKQMNRNSHLIVAACLHMCVDFIVFVATSKLPLVCFSLSTSGSTSLFIYAPLLVAYLLYCAIK